VSAWKGHRGAKTCSNRHRRWNRKGRRENKIVLRKSLVTLSGCLGLVKGGGEGGTITEGRSSICLDRIRDSEEGETIRGNDSIFVGETKGRRPEIKEKQGESKSGPEWEVEKGRGRRRGEELFEIGSPGAKEGQGSDEAIAKGRKELECREKKEG